MEDTFKTVTHDRNSPESSPVETGNGSTPPLARQTSSTADSCGPVSNNQTSAAPPSESTKTEEKLGLQKGSGGGLTEERVTAPDPALDQKIHKSEPAKRETNPLGITYTWQDFDRKLGEKLKAQFRPQSLADFTAKQLPPKEELIKGILYRRDRISLTGRRREGKTTLLTNIAMAGALGHPDFLGFRIPNPFNVVSFYLEDDPTELQEKLNRMRKGVATERYHLYTRDDFLELKISIDVRNKSFQKFIEKACDACKPDLIIFDNLGQLIGANYNNPTLINELMNFVFQLAKKYNAAVLIAAHPRKSSRSKDSLTGARDKVRLFQEPELFFEECMGSSHFINSTGSLWGVERDYDTGQTRLLLGAQRFTGEYTRTVVEKRDDDWFQVVEENIESMKKLVLTTIKRKRAWDLLPDDHDFSLKEAREMVKPELKSNGSFQPWWTELLRLGLLIPDGDRFRKKGQKVG